MREGASSITVDKTTEVKWFSVDIAGNVENGYNPDPALSTTNYRHAFVGVGPGSDGRQTIVAEAVGGPLTMQVSSSLVTMPNVTLTGADQLVSGALNSVKVLDGRGTAGGWSLTGVVSDFVGPNSIIVADNLGWAPSAKVLTGALPTLPGDQPSVAAGAAVSPGAGTGLGNARGLCTSPSGSSAGAFECGGGLTLGIPGSTRLGTYTGVLTLTLV
jgi:X-Pro dipeptidyl-peptidase